MLNLTETGSSKLQVHSIYLSVRIPDTCMYVKQVYISNEICNRVDSAVVTRPTF